MDSDPNQVILSYDATSLKTVTPTVEVNGAWQKVVVIYERGTISVSLNDVPILYHRDIERPGPYVIGTGGFVVFSCNGAADRRVRNVKRSNDGPWSFADEANIAYLNGSVGIGTNRPSTKLDVVGTAKATLFSGSGASLINIPQSGVVNLTDNVQRISTLETDLSDNVSRISTIESGVTTLTGNKTFQDDVVISGNLTVSGTTTVVDTENISIKDPIIEIGKDNAGSPLVDLGVIMTRPTNNSNVAIIFDESTDTLEIGYTMEGADATTITMDSANLFHMNVWGNVSASNLTIGQFGIVASYGLDHVTNENNSTGDTIISTNATTGLQTTANVNVGRDLRVTGNVTVDTIISTNRVGILTTSPGYDLDVHGSANVGTLTTDTVAVSSNLEVGTANLFVDTTSGNVGVGTTEPTESLDIVGNLNLQKVSNTASIKLNSNVVTEYTRSKKLIKYPRVAMTAATTAGYTVSASTTFGDYLPYLAFDNNITDTAGTTLWTSADGTYDSNDNYAYSSNKSLGGVSGEWLKLQLPMKIRPEYVRIYPRTYSPPIGNNQSPEDFVFLASNDDTNWVQLGSVTGWVTNATWGRWPIPSQTSYKYYAMVCTRTIGSTLVGLTEMEIYGIPEYDPEAHGTDVIARSVPNVPNMDWLQVYWDGQDYTSMPATVTDKSGNGATGTPNGGVGFDTEYKAFTFDGNGDYISGTHGLGTGSPVHSMSLWFKRSGVVGAYDYIAAVGTSTNFQNSAIVIYNNQIWFSIYGDELVSVSTISNNVWYHLTVTSNGGIWNTTNCKMYINGVQASVTGGSGETLAMTGTNVRLGTNTNGIEGFNGSISNFRVFNRAITGDEVWQLYAYQKEYFQVSPDVVTFKGGRLGIGTSEPQAVLDVNGSAMIDRTYTLLDNIVAQYTVPSDTQFVYIRGLDLERDGGTYKIVINMKNAVATNPAMSMYINDATTSTNYYSKLTQHTSSSNFVNLNNESLFNLGGSSQHYHEFILTRHKNTGYPICMGTGSMHTGTTKSPGAVQGWDLHSWVYYNNTNVTKLTFQTYPDDAIATGSVFTIYKYV
jgi:hypothetical protein